MNKTFWNRFLPLYFHCRRWKRFLLREFWWFWEFSIENTEPLQLTLLQTPKCSGFGDIENIVIRRMRNHKYFKRGFTIILIDKAMQGKNSKLSIRGREQQLIDFYGGIFSGKIANKINGISRINPRRSNMLELSFQNFGKI